MKRVALYARVSTKDQHPEAQTGPLAKYAEARGFEIVPDGESHAFVDHGVSGAKAERPALDRMMALVRRREVDAVVAVKLDRLARSMQHLTSLATELEALGVDLILMDQGLDTTTPGGRLLFHVMGAVAEFERSLILERTRAGVEAARKRGKVPGRRPVFVGEKEERLRRLEASGHSISQVAKIMREKRSTVARAMRRIRAERAANPFPPPTGSPCSPSMEDNA